VATLREHTTVDGSLNAGAVDQNPHSQEVVSVMQSSLVLRPKALAADRVLSTLGDSRTCDGLAPVVGRALHRDTSRLRDQTVRSRSTSHSTARRRSAQRKASDGSDRPSMCSVEAPRRPNPETCRRYREGLVKTVRVSSRRDYRRLAGAKVGGDRLSRRTARGVVTHRRSRCVELAAVTSASAEPWRAMQALTAT